MKFIFCLMLCLPQITWAQAASESDAILSRANTLYDQGNCKEALSLYQRYLRAVDPAVAGNEEVLFKSSYCYLYEGQEKMAAEGFKKYLEKNPNDQDAKLRLAVILFNQAKFDTAQKLASQVQTPDLLPEATLYLSRSYMETQDFRKAIKKIQELKDAGEWGPVLTYWKGMAYYNLNDYEQAMACFRQAYVDAPPELWVKAAAEKAFEMAKRQGRKFRGFLSLGYFNDSNVYQTGDPFVGTSSRTVKAGGQGDTGLWLSGQTSWTPKFSPDHSIAANLNYSSPFYVNDPNYDYESVGIELAPKFKVNDTTWVGLAPQYVTTAYNGIHYQDYVTLTPSISWNLSTMWFLEFSMPMTYGVGERKSSSFIPSLAAQYVASDSLAFRLGFSYSMVEGAKATYSGSGTSTALTSGVMFSSYTTLGSYLGLSYGFAEDLFMNAQLGFYKTSYTNEAVPVGAGTGAGVARSDYFTNYQIDLYKVIVPNVWGGDLSVNQYNNASAGFQGLQSGGYTTNNAYKRTYIMLSGTFMY